MTSARRSYQDACAASHGLDLIGERWALLIVRELILGPKRFTDLRDGLPGISPNVLTQRLAELEAGHILHHRKLPPPAGTWAYELTPWGLELEEVIKTLGRWAARSPGLHRNVPMGPDALILSFRTMFSPEAAGDASFRLALHLKDDRFDVQVHAGRFTAVRGEAPTPHATVTADPTALAGLVYGGQDLEAFLAAGLIRIEGDRAPLEAFLRLFPVPPGYDPGAPA